MRVAAVAFVLIIGAAIVLAFANTLNSWVLGGLLGGLAAILLCIPISLAIFTLLSRRQEARQRAAAQIQVLAAETEGELIVEADDDEFLEYSAEDENEDPFEPVAEDISPADRSRAARDHRHIPVSGYLALPPVEQDDMVYEEEDRGRQARGEPRNYPLQPRRPVNAPERAGETASSSLSSTTRRPATRSLAQHQSAALHQARQEARQQFARRRDTSAALSRRSQSSRSSATQRPQKRGSARPPAEDDYAARQAERHAARSAWHADEDFSTEELRERPRHYPRHPRSAYPRTSPTRHPDLWTGELAETGERGPAGSSRRPPRDPDRVSGNLQHPLVRRAPYLYADDPLSEEFARQIDQDRPLTRRSSLYDYDGDHEED